jgi:signal peptidase
MKKVIKVIYTTLISILLIIGILVVISAFDLNLPVKIYAVQTGSMRPAIKTGDLIFVRNESEYKIGDIITFNSGVGESNTVITHRIDDINEDGTYITKGDANSVNDVDFVSKEDIIGKYFFRIMYVGYVINFSRTPLGFFLLIIIPVMIIAYGEVDKIRNEIKKIKSEKQNI